MQVIDLPNGQKATIMKHCELADHFGVNRRTLNYWRERGMPYLVEKKYRKRTYTYHLEKVEEWVSKWSDHMYETEKRLEQAQEAKRKLSELRSKFTNIVDTDII